MMDTFCRVASTFTIDPARSTKLIRRERTEASGCSLTVRPDVLTYIYGNLESLRPMLVLRPQEISNQLEVIRRLGIISVNTA